MGSIWPNNNKKGDETSAAKTDKEKRHVHSITANPFILRRTSSMYFDEDGHLAHEFYEECRVQSPQGVVRWTMRLLRHDGIRPQGQVNLDVPRLHVDLPILMMANS